LYFSLFHFFISFSVAGASEVISIERSCIKGGRKEENSIGNRSKESDFPRVFDTI